MEKLTFWTAGAAAANHVQYITADRNWKIVHASAVASNDSDATLKIGNDADAEAYLEEAVIGDSNVPVEFEQADFVDAQFPTHEKGDVLVVTLDFDGDGGTAGEDICIAITIDSY